MSFNTLYKAILRKRAAAVLTPEAEQAAMQPPQDPSMMGGQPPMDPSMGGGAPMDPSMMGGQPPMDPSMGGGMPPQAAGPAGGEIPPEILQDQGFLQWLASQGVQFDPQSGTFIDMQSGQPLPAEAIMQAYEVYMQQMQGAGGGPEGGAPMDPSMMGGQPPMDQSMGGGMPPEAGGMPMDPSMAGGMPPQGGGLPPEALQDQGFMQFMQAVGVMIDPQSGMAVDQQSGQPLPPEAVAQAYDMYMQQMGGGQAEGAPGGMPGDQGAMPEGPEAGAGMGGGLPPEFMDQIQSAIDASIENYTAQLDKKIETLLDKLETVKQALESMRDTDDARDKAAKDESKQLQEDLAAELNPVVKTASARPQARKSDNVPVNLFDLLLKG